MVFTPYDVFVSLFQLESQCFLDNMQTMIWVRFTLMGMSKSFLKTMVWKRWLLSNVAIFVVCMLNYWRVWIL